jgi:CRP-like cAMP-binding protein
LNHPIPQVFRQRFSESVRKFHPLSDEDIDKFLAEFEVMEYRKGEVLLREGEVCKHLYYILSGGIRCFLLDENGKEVNLHFYFENDLASEWKSLGNQEPSQRYLVTLSNTKVLRAFRPDYYPVLSSDIDLVQASARFFQDTLFSEEEHAEMLRKLSAEERYQYVLDTYPHYLQKISLTQLASWLGISRESLSRIRNKIAS